MNEVELIQGLINRLDSLAKRVSEENPSGNDKVMPDYFKGKRDFYSYNQELDLIKNEILVTIRRSFGESDAYMQKLNKIQNPCRIGGGLPVEVSIAGSYSAVFFDHINQLVNLLNALKYEIGKYGKAEPQSSGPTLIVMKPGSKLAFRDYIDHPVTVNAYLTALMQAVEESNIPESDKITLKQQLALLVANPYISGTLTGLSTSLIAPLIMKALGLG